MTHALASPDDQRVTFIELFFDLVFVFSVTQVVGLLHGWVGLPAAGAALLVFWLVWWGWTQFTWALNAANTEHPRIQLAILFATAVAFFMAVGIPGALDTAPLLFAVPYIALRIVGLVVYYWVARANDEQRRAVLIFGSVSLAGLVAVAVGAALGGTGLLWWWGGAIALDLLAAGVGGTLEGWNLHPDHFAERHGLIVIIALGETLIVAAAGLADAPRSGTVVTTAVLAVAVSAALWWSYYPRIRPRLEHALAAHEGGARSSMARDVFSVIHFPMLCGVIAIAVALEAALAHPDEPFAGPLRIACAAGMLLFVGGTGAAVWRASGRLPGWRVAVAAAGAALAITLGGPPWITLGLVTLTVIVAAATDGRAPPVSESAC